MGSVFGRYFTVSTFGESHGAGVGVVVDGVPAGLPLDEAAVQKELNRRKPGTSKYVTPRKEDDIVEIISGTAEGATIGSPVAMLVRNRNARSKDYGPIREMFRPGHADYTYFKKYGITPQPGGGRASGRETIARVAAGAVARIVLGEAVSIKGYSIEIGPVKAVERDPGFAESDPLRFADPGAAGEAAECVEKAMNDGDSVGGVVEIVVEGVPAGLGDPAFFKLDAMLGMGMLSIGAVKGVEFGAGFNVTALRGSEANDPIGEDGFLSNNAGGVLGGISTGQPVVIRLAVKPTSSISRPQQTLDIHGAGRTIEVHGRHDPCLCPRIVPVAEAMAAIVLADALMENNAHHRR